MSTGKQAATLLSSKTSDDWGTSPEIYDALNREFGPFTLDPNADVTNHKCETYYTIEQNGLSLPWAPHRVFCNPPFSLNKEFVLKGKQEANKGAFVLFLIPARTNSSWFHNYVWDDKLHRTRVGVEIRFVRGRIPYIGTAGEGAPFPVMVVIFHPGLPL